MGVSNIEWTDYTFNPWIGCTKVSPGCKHCYAEADIDNRRKRVKWGINGTRSVTSYMYWRQALKWNREAKEAGVRKRVFCASLADVFEDWPGQVIDSKGNGLWFDKDPFVWSMPEEMRERGAVGPKMYISERLVDCEGVPTFNHHTEDYIVKHKMTERGDWDWLTLETIRYFLFKMIEKTPDIDWLILTKRPENIFTMIPEHWRNKLPDNVWIGTSVENQEEANNRIPHLLKVPAVVRFLSCEPMLEEIDLTEVMLPKEYGVWPNEYYINCLTKYDDEHFHSKHNDVNWVICGGESGSKKRPFKTDWAYRLKMDCADNAVSFFMKQIDKVQPVPEDLLIRQFPEP